MRPITKYTVTYPSLDELVEIAREQVTAAGLRFNEADARQKLRDFAGTTHEYDADEIYN